MWLLWSGSQINKACIKIGRLHRVCYKFFNAKFVKWDIRSIQKPMLDSCTRLRNFIGGGSFSLYRKTAKIPKN